MSASAKLILLGDQTVGKTAIISRAVSGTIPLDYRATIGWDMSQMTLAVEGLEVKLVIWDTAGQEAFRCITAQYYRDAAIALVVFSLIEPSSLDGARRWIDDVKSATPSVVIILAGNKSDLVPGPVECGKDAVALAERYGIEYVETSALTGSGIRALFQTAAKKYIDHTDRIEPLSCSRDTCQSEAIVLDKPPHSDTPKRTCC
jgi:small GTP-binding protein